MSLSDDPDPVRAAALQQAMGAVVKLVEPFDDLADLLAVTTFPLVRVACADPDARTHVVGFLRILAGAVEAGGDVRQVSMAMMMWAKERASCH